MTDVILRKRGRRQQFTREWLQLQYNCPYTQINTIPSVGIQHCFVCTSTLIEFVNLSMSLSAAHMPQEDYTAMYRGLVHYSIDNIPQISMTDPTSNSCSLPECTTGIWTHFYLIDNEGFVQLLHDQPQQYKYGTISQTLVQSFDSPCTVLVWHSNSIVQTCTYIQPLYSTWTLYYRTLHTQLYRQC